MDTPPPILPRLLPLLRALQARQVTTLYRTLMILHMFQHGPSRPTDLAQAATAPLATIRLALDSLHGLVVEAKNFKDRRSVLVDLTPKFRRDLEGLIG